MRALLLAGVWSVLATGCSFTTAAGLDCETNEDCGIDQLCTQKVCLPLPVGCKDTPYGSNKPNAIRMGALLPIHTSTARATRLPSPAPRRDGSIIISPICHSPVDG